MLKVSPSWHPFAAFVLPFIVFAIATSIEGMESLKAWYPLLYSIKTAAILGILWWGLRYYPAWSTKGMVTGLVFGLLGGIAWIVLCTWNIEQNVLPGVLVQLGDWLNMPNLGEWIKPGSRVGFNPFSEFSPVSAWIFTAIRLIGLILVVPIMEELFWRGFLNRFLIDENWQQVSWGHITRMSFIVVTVAFVAVHAEWTAALVWGMGINLVYWWTRNLWACIVAHAVSNAVLGYYILVYEQWHLW